MSMHSTAAEDAAYLRQHIPRHPDELASTDVWEHSCDHCGLIVQGGVIALALHHSIVHADLSEVTKAQQREASRERARLRARERYRRRKEEAARTPTGPPAPRTFRELAEQAGATFRQPPRRGTRPQQQETLFDL